MSTAAAHPWRLVAPWYRWPAQGVPGERTARDTRPAIQKFESTNFVNDFLADPQRSLVFDGEDEVQLRQLLPKLPDLDPPFSGRRRRLSDETLVATGITKLYLTIHKRFYLVTCELRCDVPGFPRVDRTEACEAGFVVRRRRVTFPAAQRANAVARVRALAAASSRLADLVNLDPAVPSDTDGVLSYAWHDIASVGAATSELIKARQELKDWATAVGLESVHEGWFEDGPDGIGHWADVAQTPSQLGTEKVYRLLPLIPDPRLSDHDGRGVTLYFGVVPTGGSDNTADGHPRFDDDQLYEIRCFVRRHLPRCPRTGDPGDCKGPLTWSQPSQAYRLAPHLDPIGTAHRSVTIQLPDLRAMEAGVPAPPHGVRMVSKPGSVMNIDGSEFPPGGSMESGEGEICTFALPLITIVATFVLKLFLPIVVFAFQLWFLLKLKFCLPPSAEVDAALAAELDVIPRALEADFDAGINIDLGLSVQDALTLEGLLRADFNTNVGPEVGDVLTTPAPGRPAFSVDPLLRLRRVLAVKADPVEPALVYEPHVERDSVVPR